MNKINAIAVFCGSSDGADPAFGHMAAELGMAMASQNIQLIYGGAQVGLMGTLADAVMKGGGSVIGVIPQFLSSKEIAHHSITELIVVDNMHERKAKMNELCDGVIALPGGYGTLEELFEMLTWGQLGLHNKPIGVLNVNNYYDHLISLINHMANNRLLSEINRDMLLFDNEINSLMNQMRSYEPVVVGKWFGRMSEEEKQSPF